MNDRVLATLFVLVAWWLSTAVVLKTVWLAKSLQKTSVFAFSVLAVIGMIGAVWSSHFNTTAAAYVAFTCALAVWAWHELTFLLGIVSGPRKEPCPPTARGVERFVYATRVVIHHEIALAVTLVAIFALTWKQPNQIAAWTFAVLWIMRLSAKLNVFLGVRNLSEQFIPDHLRYMLSYFRRARMNALMPVSIVASSVVVVHLIAVALAPDATRFVMVGHILIAALLGLAALEHVFLALPLPDAILWRWAIRAKRVEAAQ